MAKVTNNIDYITSGRGGGGGGGGGDIQRKIGYGGATRIWKTIPLHRYENHTNSYDYSIGMKTILIHIFEVRKKYFIYLYIGNNLPCMYYS